MIVKNLIPALLCSASLMFAGEQNKAVEIDTFDYPKMFAISVAILQNEFSESMEDHKQSSQEPETLSVKAQAQRQAAVISAYIYYLIGLLRMNQELACLRNPIDGEKIRVPVAELGQLFAQLPLAIRQQAVTYVLAWVKEEAHASWNPEFEEETKKLYIDASTWKTARDNATERFCELIQQDITN